MFNPAPLLIIPLFLTQNNPSYREAATSAAQAYYIQSGLQKSVTSFIDDTIPNDVKKYSVTVTAISQIFIDKKIQINFTF